MRIRVILSVFVATALSVCLMAAAAAAATYTVNTTSDTDSSGTGACATGGSCSFREAVNAVNAGSGGDTITLQAGTYMVSNASGFGPIVITKGVTINGAGAGTTVLDGGNAATILNFETGDPTSISNVTLTHGSADRGGAIYNRGNLTVSSDVFSQNKGVTSGGAIENLATLTVIDSTFSGNSVSVGHGGAINQEAALGAQKLTVKASTFTGNNAVQRGGAINVNIQAAVPAVSISQSLFANDSTGGGGGAVFVSGGGAPFHIDDSTFTGGQASKGGAINDSDVGSTLTNDTLAGNSATASGGNIASNPGIPTLVNTIVAAGTSPTGSDCNSTVTSGGHNIEDANTCGLTGAGDKPSTNPKLGSLANNGGPTQTIALLAGSPAINAADNTACPPTDQRGVTRPQQNICDIGAYESAPPTATTGVATGVGPTGATINGSAVNPDALGATVTLEYGLSTAYGSTVAKPLAALSGPTAYSAALVGLRPNTTYHYAVVVTNPDGTSTGADRTFTTALAPNRFSVKSRHVSKTGTITVKLGAPWSGKFTGKATVVLKHRKSFTYGTGRTSASRAGTVALTINPSRHARTAVILLGRATVVVTITFTPNGGRPSHRTVKVTIKVNRKGSFS